VTAPSSTRAPALEERRKTKGLARYNPESEQGIIYRLSRVLQEPRLFVVQGGHMNLPESAQQPEAIYDPEQVRLWRFAIKRDFALPFFVVLEVDGRGAVHAHVTAEKGAHSELEGEPREKSWQNWSAYMGKPCDARVIGKSKLHPHSLEAQGLLLESQQRAKRKGGRLPRKSWGCGIPRKV
jgi:hypothetical protein